MGVWAKAQGEKLTGLKQPWRSVGRHDYGCRHMLRVHFQCNNYHMYFKQNAIVRFRLSVTLGRVSE